MQSLPTTTEVAQAFLRQLRESLGEQNFAEVCRQQTESPVAGVCYSHDYCDANTVMGEALSSLGVIAFPEGEDGMPDWIIELWNASWDKAQALMTPTPLD